MKATNMSLLDRLKQGDLLISDGATGTYLQDHGLESDGCRASRVAAPQSNDYTAS